MTEQTPAQQPALTPRRVPKADERGQGPKPDAAGKAERDQARSEGRMPTPKSGGISQDDEKRPGFVRQPFGAITLKLSAPKREGYHRHWFNDVLDRIQQAKAAGYEHVCEPGTKKPMKRVVGSAKGGGGLTSYLMEIPKEWFEEDMAAQQRRVDEVDAAIRGGQVAKKDGDERYVPDKGIRIQND